MNFYKTYSSIYFLEDIASFVVKNFHDNDRLKIVLPTRFACSNLQRILAKKMEAIILPQIIPISDMVSDYDEIITLDHNKEKISLMEERIILSEIIHCYPLFQFQFDQSLKFSGQLSNLFYEFIYNKVSIHDVKQISDITHDEHFNFIYHFLSYAYNNWKQRINLMKKINSAEYKIKNLRSEINYLKANHNNVFIMAGILGSNKIVWDFIAEITLLNNMFFILPPFPEVVDNINIFKIELSENNPLYCLSQLLKYLKRNLLDFKLLNSKNSEKNYNSLSYLLLGEISKDADIKHKELEYIECDNIFEEAEIIGNICLQNVDKRIGLTFNNEKNKSIYINHLIKYSIKFYDLFGVNIADTDLGQLIIIASDLICNSFNIGKLMSFLKNPVIFSQSAINLERYIKKHSYFITSYQHLSEMIDNTKDLELITLNHKIKEFLNIYPPNKFGKLVKSIINSVVKFYPSIWDEDNNNDLSNFFARLIKLKLNFQIKDITTFPSILKSLMLEVKTFYNNVDSANTVISSPRELELAKFDIIILADFNDGRWPKDQVVNPWLNRKMRRNLSLNYDEIFQGLFSYNLYLLLQNKKVFITRSKNQGINKTLLPSKYISKLV